MDTIFNIPADIFDTLYAAFDEGILILDANRDICYLNAISKNWLEADAEDVKGVHIPAFSQENSQFVYAIVNRLSVEIKIVTPEDLPSVLLALHDDTSKTIVRIREKSILWNESAYYLITLYDVKRELEAELLQKAVFQISQAAGKATDLPALFKIVHEIISSLIPTPNLFIATYDEISEFISFPYYVDERDYLDVIEKQKLRSRDRKVRRGSDGILNPSRGTPFD